MNASLRPGVVLRGQFRLDAVLGQGGMSQVWRAETLDGRTVAIKLPRPELAGHAGAHELIRREFTVLESVDHPHVVAALDLIQVDESPALVTEYLGAGDLVSLCGSHPQHWVSAARDVAEALEHIHDQGMVHRDVKPRNALLRNSGDASLVDFALSAPLGGPAPKRGGSAAYQSLARRQGEAPAVRDDLHAFAALVYELISGRLPFGIYPSRAILEAVPLPLDAPDGPPILAELNELVLAALGPDPKQRPGSMSAFLDVLESAVADWE